jgi:lysophospholipase L1-like esterase
MAPLLAPRFRAAPEQMFSADGYHPSAAAYALAAEALLLRLLDELGIEVNAPAPAAPPVLGQAHTRLSVMSRLWRHPLAGSPAPSSSQPVATD